MAESLSEWDKFPSGVESDLGAQSAVGPVVKRRDVAPWASE